MNRVSAITNNFQASKLECLPLTPSEFRVARLLAWGYTQKEIGSMLFLSPLTIAVHLRNIYSELGIHKETDLTRWFSISMIFNEENMLRVFRSGTIKPFYTRVAKPVRVRRYKDVFELQIA